MSASNIQCNSLDQKIGESKSNDEMETNDDAQDDCRDIGPHKRDISSHSRDKFAVRCHCHRVICDFT